jgi:hypothetical protein
LDLYSHYYLQQLERLTSHVFSRFWSDKVSGGANFVDGFSIQLADRNWGTDIPIQVSLLPQHSHRGLNNKLRLNIFSFCSFL